MNARGRTLCIAVTTTFSFCAFGLGYLTWSRARCEERTLLSLNPDLRQLGAYELELSGQGYRARCRLVLRQETFVEVDAQCTGDPLLFRENEKALRGFVLPRGLAAVHLRLAQGEAVLYDGEVTARDHGTRERRCVERDAVVQLRITDGEPSRP